MFPLGHHLRIVGRQQAATLGGKTGFEPMPMTPAEFKTFVRSEVEDASRVLQAAGIKPQ